MTGEGYEIDFQSVGEGERSGDAIAVRFGNLAGNRDEQFVMVIDGGTKKSGEGLVEHIQTYYDTDSVNAVISTHPDEDHASGLTVVLEELKVDYLVMHRPWAHSRELMGLFRDGRITPNSLKERLERALNNASELEEIAKRKKITIVEPFSDNPNLNDYITVLGPSQSFYEELLANFRETPESVQESPFARYLRATLETAKEVVKKVFEFWDFETLEDPANDASTPENNTSVILLLEFAGEKFLFTGDAGVPVLTEAADKIEELGIDLSNLKFIQIPHHGSKRNIGPTILDRLLGPKRSTDQPDKTAFVSASEDGAPKHPAKKVTNAFRRRGCKVCATQGQNIRHKHNAPARGGWTSLDPLPFYEEIEE